MVAYLTVGIDSAYARTRIDAVPVTAGLITTAFRMIKTFGPSALDERVATVTGGAGTNRTSTGRLLTHGTYTTRTAQTSLPYGGEPNVSEHQQRQQ